MVLIYGCLLLNNGIIISFGKVTKGKTITTSMNLPVSYLSKYSIVTGVDDTDGDHNNVACTYKILSKTNSSFTGKLTWSGGSNTGMSTLMQAHYIVIGY